MGKSRVGCRSCVEYLGDLVLDPFAGVGTAVAAAVRQGRRGCGAEKMPEYIKIARERIAQAMDGTLPVRPMNTPVYDPNKAGNSLTRSPWDAPYPPPDPVNQPKQYRLLQERAAYVAKK